MLKLSLQKHLHTADGDLLLHLDLELKKGEFVSLYGASGAGKTSILRMLAGFMKPDSGFIHINDGIWFDRNKKINISPQHRNIGFVFQDYALFPNMNVQENIRFALSKDERSGIVDELLEITGLTKLALRKPDSLSGGQKQRVALARAIARKPALLLLDEPLSAIDREMRVQLQGTLQEVHQRYGLTTIMVSHDVDEIIRLSDRLIHIAKDSVTEHSSPAAFLHVQQGNITAIKREQGKTYVTVVLDDEAANLNTGDQIKLQQK